MVGSPRSFWISICNNTMGTVGDACGQESRVPPRSTHTSAQPVTGGLSMSRYIYTNWRGKQFVIDEHFVDDMKKRMSMDDVL